MTTRLKILLGILSLLIAFASGRWLAPTKTKIVTQTVTVEKKVVDTSTQERGHTVTVIVKSPDGTTKTTITHDDTINTKTAENDNVNSSTITTKETSRSESKTTVMALAGVDVTKPGLPDYGVSVSRSVVGPIVIGVFGFKSGMIGGGVGLSF